MSMLEMEAGLTGLAHTFENQKMAMDLMDKTLGQEQPQHYSQQENTVQTTQLAKAVTGVGNKLDLMV